MEKHTIEPATHEEIDLPKELWVKIISYLGFADRKSIRLASEELVALLPQADLFIDKIWIIETAGAGWIIFLDEHRLPYLSSLKIDAAIEELRRLFKRIICRQAIIQVKNMKAELMMSLEKVVKICKYDSILFKINDTGNKNHVLSFLTAHPCSKLTISLLLSDADSEFLLKLPQTADIVFTKGNCQFEMAAQLNGSCITDESLIELVKYGHSLEMPPVGSCSGATLLNGLELISKNQTPQWMAVRISHASRDEFLQLLGLRLKKGKMRTEKQREDVLVYPRLKCANGHAIDYRGTNIEVSHSPTREGILCFIHISNFHHLSEKEDYGFRWLSETELEGDAVLSQAYRSRIGDYFM